MRTFRWGGIGVAAVLAAALVVASQVSARDGHLGRGGRPIKIGISLPITGDFSQPGTAALKGYRVWERYVNTARRPARSQGEARDQGRAQSDKNTIVNDYNALINSNKVDLLLGTFSSLLNLPASAVAEKFHMVYVEPAGGSPKMFNRGFQYLFFAQQATAVHQGDLFSKWVKTSLAGEESRRRPIPRQDDPFAAPVAEGTPGEARGGRDQDRLSDDVRARHDRLRHDRLGDQVEKSGADIVVQGAVFDDGVGLIRSMKKVGYSPQCAVPDLSSVRGEVVLGRHRPREHRGHLLRGQLEPCGLKGPRYPLNQDFLSLYQKMYGAGGDPGGGLRRRLRGGTGADDRAQEGRQGRPGRDEGLAAQPSRPDDPRPAELGLDRGAAPGVPARAVARAASAGGG